ncbi:SAM-dependent methyltransferase [Cerasibacillus quisquiliarum]|uniref:N-methyltransferase n=1 Tax=Cerasibacillus quisquiliarum TaxID=227865 RepID=A0A511UTB6_9BACI|nr:class I SAM-dependent methyltransferase [Cerasibacillus quisquiliarum]MBB5145293.1 SAM-dependent methyltransferase [Cerasibacillus quisquiliarum]GEN29816.1 N-methyltransferase [Cerasibacillus quisquiliarum]
MKLEEALNFYKKQFHDFKNVINLTTILDKEVDEIEQQIGRHFQTVLELGAGNGQLARSIAHRKKDVTTIELVPEMVEFANSIPSSVKSLCGSFYDLPLNKTFDVILYIDGFGVGNDDDQLKLLHRIYGWMNDDGVALIDIYQPNYWKKIDGKSMYPLGTKKVARKYGFIEETNEMTDTWWHVDNPENVYTQTLTCYSPDDIVELANQANLKVKAFYPGGAMDFDTWTYNETVSLSSCLSYRVKLVK